MVDTGNEPGATEEPAEWTVGEVPPDTGVHDESVDRTEHAPLAQWASRVGARPQPEPEEIQAPVDPWPLPIQGLATPPDAAPTDDLLTLSYDSLGRPVHVPVPVPRKSRRGLRAALAAAVVVVLAAAGGITVAMWPSQTSDVAQPSPAGSPPAFAPSTGPSTPVAVGDDSAPMPTGPIAQGVPPDSIYAMDEICLSQTYWPVLPKRTGNKPPHPILVYGDKGGSVDRLPYSMFYTWFRGSKADQAVWAGENPATIRLVACVDRVAAGSKVRYCPSSTTRPATERLTLYRASYRVRLYESATARKLLDTRIDAKDTTCPYVGSRIPANKKIYMEITDATFAATLRRFVEQ